MPKMKSKKALTKRVKVSASGKLMRHHANTGHRAYGKSTKRKRHLMKPGSVHPTDYKILNSLVVEEWFKGGSPKVDLSSPFLKYKSFIVDPDRNLVADNIHELIPLLLDNEKLAIGYLYNGRISSWLESCGNQKLSTIVKDIVVNRYPVDQRAGLMAAVYAMEPTYPYKDIKGNLCDDAHSVAISLLSYQKDM